VSSEAGVIGTFAAPRETAQAILALRAAGFLAVRVAMPAPYPEVVRALDRPRSPMAFVALPGAVLGIACGLALTIGTAVAWPLVTGGKPVVSLPPFVIIAFELAVLVGALANLAGVLLGGWRGGRASPFPASQHCSGQRIGVHVAGGDQAEAARLLRDCGAVEVHDAG